MPVSSTSKEVMKVKVWARRVWTLELSLVSILSTNKDHFADDPDLVVLYLIHTISDVTICIIHC